ncbi:MAG: nucleotide sugar dehydrogenase [Candidatus Omnitrophica bacterium]|nr:nucleotide sugar dehydrogenase [Candidatus Omnitrophota bacterium]
MDSFFREFKKKIHKKQIKIAVVGLGYVGLPLAVEFAKKGFSVLGIDVDKDRLNRIKKRKSYILDVKEGDLKAVLANGRFRVEGGFHSLNQIDVIIICVPTPLKRKYSPDISFIIQAAREIKKHLCPGQLIVLESTTYPGTTEEVILPLLESKGLKCGEDFYLAFSPERIDPGNVQYPLNKIPKVVGGITSRGAELTTLLYKTIIKKVIVVSSARTAEAVKLFENTFRIVNIGLIDEMAMMAHKMGINIWEAIEAAKTKPFGFMPFYPGPGCGGHCIPKDPLYLYWKARHHGFSSRFIKLASDIITYMPEYVTQRVMDLLSKENKKISKARILVVGVTYKKDVKDLRKSPALDIIEILQNKNSLVSYYDPLIPYLKFNHINLQSITFNKKELNKFDCAVIASDHSSVDYDFILRNSRFIFDTRNVYKNIKDKKIFRL